MTKNIKISAIPSSEYILNGITNKVYVMIKIETSSMEDTKKVHNPLELSIVLDRSGSMQGDKINFSKDAVNQVIENLRKGDLLNFVIYDEIIDVVFNKGDISMKNVLKNQVNSIYSRGSTNLAGGMLQGFEVFDKNADHNRSRRIFLFSDGLANIGIKDNEGITKLAKDIYGKGINISAFGIGSDFNEELMMGIAEHAGGDYFFINGADTIPSIVGEAMDGLLNIIASNAILKLRGINGSTVKKIYAYELTHTLQLGDIKELEERKFLVEVEIQPEKLDKSMEFLCFDLIYNPIDDLLTKQEINHRLSIKKTDDETLIQQENEEIVVLKGLLEVTEQELKVTELLNNLKIDEAITLQTSLIAALTNLQKSDKSGDVGHKLKISNDTLQRMQKDKEIGSYKLSSKFNSYNYYQTRSSKLRRHRDS